MNNSLHNIITGNFRTNALLEYIYKWYQNTTKNDF